MLPSYVKRARNMLNLAAKMEKLERDTGLPKNLRYKATVLKDMALENAEEFERLAREKKVKT